MSGFFTLVPAPIISAFRVNVSLRYTVALIFEKLSLNIAFSLQSSLSITLSRCLISMSLKFSRVLLFVVQRSLKCIAPVLVFSITRCLIPYSIVPNMLYLLPPSSNPISCCPKKNDLKLERSVGSPSNLGNLISWCP